MKTTKILTILVLVLASMANGAQKLTVNSQDVISITIKIGQSCTVEVVSDDAASYVDYVGFDNGLVLGSFLHLQTKPEAGNQATVIEVNPPDFYGYYVRASGITPGNPSPGIHFVFQYTATQLGETDLKLYDDALTLLKDSVHIVVIPVEVEVGTVFTYQGRLIDANNAADGLYDLHFKLYDAAAGGSQKGSTINIGEVDVIDGYFTVALDFGSDVFTGDARWLEISVRAGELNDPNVYTPLEPRQRITPTPYALQTRGVFVDNSGKVGIGTTVPEAPLTVSSAETASTGLGGLTVRNTEGGKISIGCNQTGIVHTWIQARENEAFRDIALNPRGGDVFIGQGATTQTQHRLYVNGGGYFSGNVGIGTTSPSERLDVEGTARLRGIAAGSGTTVVADGNGKLLKSSSSRRYKTNIANLDADTDAVLNLRPVRFQWKTTGQNDIGLIAEEVEQQLNDLVIYDNEGKPDAVKYDRVSLYLLAAVKDLKAENESLKKANEDIKNRLAAMESLMAKLSLQQEGGIK